MFSKSVYGVGRVLRDFAKPQFQLRLQSSCIVQSMKEHKVIPDVISDAPRNVAKVIYPSGVEVSQGNELTPRQVKHRPDVFWPFEKGAYYLLCMTDPDAPSRADPKLREWQHWLVGNIPCDEVFRGETLSAYIGSAPAEGTGLHRYVFLIFKQPKRLIFREDKLPNNSGDMRSKFSIQKYAKRYDLGKPVAGNFYQAEWDDYVPELYKKLGM